jgi:hypothetical protein
LLVATLRDGIEDHLLDGIGFGEHTTILRKPVQSSRFNHVPMTTIGGVNTCESAVFLQLGLATCFSAALSVIPNLMAN